VPRPACDLALRKELMRIVARTPAFRTRVSDLIRRQPADLWYSPGLGWILDYPLIRASDKQRDLIFVIADMAGPLRLVAGSLVECDDSDGDYSSSVIPPEALRADA
jgi:hypothetical protein